MRRIVEYQVMTFMVAVVFMAGCSNSSSPDVALRTDITETEYEIVLPDSAEATNLVTGEKVGIPARLADDPSAATPEPLPTEIADGADSDAPDGYRPLSADEADNSSRDASQPPQPPKQEAGDDEATKRNGRRSDGDDPEAPLIVAKIAEQQDDEPLNNGRGDSAKPIPEGQRVAVAPTSVSPEPTELGRDPEAKPGAELTTPPKAKPTTKPVEPSRKTLADLSESVQALDKDGDGQLGVYEWPREKLAEFKTLDSNEDGFLTPPELVAGQKKLSEAEAAKTENEPAVSSKEKAEAKEAVAAKSDESPKQDDVKAPAADTTDNEESKEETKSETPDTSADEDDSTTDDKPTQGS